MKKNTQKLRHWHRVRAANELKRKNRTQVRAKRTATERPPKPAPVGIIAPGLMAAGVTSMALAGLVQMKARSTSKDSSND
ncbi:MAG: hypothetical protein GY807_24050 [Gammaproteobacteria bacterium]|nr:hypothetical protein [Gammaproteobacteria bacterium]